MRSVSALKRTFETPVKVKMVLVRFSSVQSYFLFFVCVFVFVFPLFFIIHSFSYKENKTASKIVTKS